MENSRYQISRRTWERPWVAAAFLCLALIAYFGVVVFLTPFCGNSARALGVPLVIAAAWLSGTWGVVIIVVLIHFMNMLVDFVLSQPVFVWTVASVPPFLVFLFIGLVTSRMRSLSQRAKLELIERRLVEAMLRKSEALLRQSEESYRLTFDNNPHAMWICDIHTLRFLATNETAIKHYGYSAEEFHAMTIVDLLRPEDSSLAVDGATGPLPEFHQVGLRKHRKKDGTLIDVEITTHEVAFKGKVARLALAHDVTEHIRAQHELKYQALHDGLTGLPNRTLLRSHIEQGITLAGRNNRALALLLVDLDRFKEINDTLGHHFGDLVLKMISQRFRVALRDSDFIARLGGDEFAILLPETTQLGAIEAADRVQRSLRESFVLNEHTFIIGASIGVAVYPEHGQDPDALLRMADIAMYAAKRSGSGVIVYTPDRDQLTSRRLALVGELRRGIETDQLLLYYQPKFDLKTQGVHAAEALVRWQHPRDGLMAPDQFVPLAEHTGLIKPLSHWVLNTALVQSRLWHRSGINLDVAVNLPAASIQDPHLVGMILRLLDNTDALPSWLTIEITETAMMNDPRQAASILQQLHGMGVKVSIDDFGTGHSSLAYLQDFPIDEVKIDRSFVKKLTSDLGTAAIVQSIIDMSHKLGFQVVAEGVDDQETLDLLNALNCDFAQGFLLCHPLPPGEFTDWLCQPARRSLARIEKSSEQEAMSG